MSVVINSLSTTLAW